MASPSRKFTGFRTPIALGVVTALVAVLRGAPALADPDATVPTVEERTIFLQLMTAPDDPVLNLKYGHLAMAKGRLNRALEAFRRVLAADPTNQDAITAIKQIQENRRAEEAAKPQTDFSLVVGGQYESNAAQRDPSYQAFDDTMAKAGLGIHDQRQIFGRTVDSTAQIYKSVHNRYRAGDLLYLGVDSGPVYELEGATLRVAPLVRYAKINTRRLFVSSGISLRYLRETEDAFKGVTVTATYDDYMSDYETYKGPHLEAAFRYQFYDILDDTDSLSVVPTIAHVHGVGDGGSHRYEGLTVSAAYSRPLSVDMVLTGALTLEGRWYAAKESDEPTSSQRKDIRVKPELRLTFIDLLPEGGQLETRVNYEANFSNDYDKTYRGYLIGATARWDF